MLDKTEELKMDARESAVLEKRKVQSQNHKV